MNLFKKAAVSLALGSMALAPVAASAAQPLAPLSVDGARSVTASTEANEFNGNASSIFIAILAFAAIIAAIIIAADGTDDSPTSP